MLTSLKAIRIDQALSQRKLAEALSVHPRELIGERA